jgi:hypothetical protein
MLSGKIIQENTDLKSVDVNSTDSKAFFRVIFVSFVLLFYDFLCSLMLTDDRKQKSLRSCHEHERRPENPLGTMILRAFTIVWTKKKLVPEVGLEPT